MIVKSWVIVIGYGRNRRIDSQHYNARAWARRTLRTRKNAGLTNDRSARVVRVISRVVERKR
jgi:hypothetical protein